MIQWAPSGFSGNQVNHTIFSFLFHLKNDVIVAERNRLLLSRSIDHNVKAVPPVPPTITTQPESVLTFDISLHGQPTTTTTTHFIITS